MGVETTDKPIIKFNGNTNIYYESLEQMKSSIRRDDYINAFRIIKEIVRGVKEKSDNDTGTDTRNREQVYNIVFFTGERGAGKTSTMLSFMEFLKDYYRKTNSNKPENVIDDLRFKNFANPTLPDDNYMFTGIDYIDASALNEKDDILGSVLSNMLTKWKKEEWNSNTNSGIVRGKDYEHKKRKLRMCFNNVYERLRDLRSTKDMTEKDSDMFLETLENLSLSSNLKLAFKDLIDTYLDIMVYPKSEKNINEFNHFLVISIDDLDMNINHGFMLLEQIRKYLMFPNVIVLLSADYEQLEKICCNHYSKEFKHLERTVYNSQYIIRLAREYLEKMVPKQNQINLSSGLKWKFFAADKILLKYEPSKEICLNCDIENEITYEGTVCEIISEQIENYFNLAFQKGSLCVKYLTPHTLRELASWTIQIHNLKKCETGDLEVYRSNVKYFMEDLFYPLCKKFLSVDKQKVIEILEILEPEQQVNIVTRELENCKKEYEKTIGINKSESNLSNELLWLLSYVSKIDKDGQVFVSVFLIYLTITLTNYTVMLENSDNITMKKNAAQQLVRYYTANNGGMFGRWEEMMMPSVFDNMTKVKRITTVSNIDKNILELDLQEELTKESIKNDEIKEKLMDFQYILLLFQLDITESNPFLWEKNCNKIGLNKSCKGNFSFIGFILNLLEGATIVECFLNSLYYILEPEKIGQNYSTYSDLKEISIIPKVKKYLYNSPLLPINDLEFMLYLGENLREHIGRNVIEKNILNIYKNYVKQIKKCLTEYYGNKGKDIYSRLKKFPLIKKVLTEDVDSDFSKMLDNMIKPLMKPYGEMNGGERWEGTIEEKYKA